MYEQHFGLKRLPFRVNATGTDVFVGPQTAKTMADLKKAFSSYDTIVTVSGPVGTGKSTLVIRALDATGDDSKIVCVGRMQLDSSDVLELLLQELGLTELPNGTIQKFAAFRRTLKDLQDSDTRVIIVVEDGMRISADTLAELEALTAADGGDSDGASIVVMGDEQLDEYLKSPQLARFQQRIRQRLTVSPLSAAELRGYLMHCFRLAGGDFEQLFEADAANLLHPLSRGIPRIANNLVDSSLSSAAGSGAAKVTSNLLQQVAKDEYGLSAEGPDNAPPAASQPATAPEPVAKPAPTQPQEEVEIPELIQDTMPDLVILAAEEPEVAKAPDISPPPQPKPEAKPQAAPKPKAKPQAAPQPEATPQAAPKPEAKPNAAPQSEAKPQAEPEPAAEASAKDIPAWDRDPTLAQLKPDLAALEQAMAAAHGADPESQTSNSLSDTPAKKDAEPEKIPEITLDLSILQPVDDNLIDEPGEISPPAAENKAAPAKSDKPAADTDKPPADTDKPATSHLPPTQNKLPPKKNKKADTGIVRIAKQLAEAKTIEDVDDKLAETLFGEEINLIAAEVLANPELYDSANDKDQAEEQNAPNVAKSDDSAPGEVSLEPLPLPTDTGYDLTASQRLNTVRALNANMKSAASKPAPIPAPADTPGSFEDQINTSLTQTLKALDVKPPLSDDDDDKEEDKDGFLSRFKLS